MRITPNFHCIEPWIWNDPRVRSLGRNARSLFGLMLTFPKMSKVAGVILATGRGAFTDEWQSTEEEFVETFAELERAGLCAADWKNRVVYVMPLLTEMICNRPRSPSQASAFGSIIFREAPDCPLVRQVDCDMRHLMCTSPSLMESYLRCRPMSSADAQAHRDSGRPLPQQPRQLGLALLDASEHTAGASAGEDSGLSQPSTIGSDDREALPALEILPGGDPDGELESGLQQLKANAGSALGSFFSEVQLTQVRLLWQTAYTAGWRGADLADLGTWIGAGGLAWLTKVPPTAYLASYLGDALAKMDERRKHSPMRPPQSRSTPSRSAGAPAGRPRLRWTPDKLGRIWAVDDGGSDRVNAIIDDEWDLGVMRMFHQRHLEGDETLTISMIREALEKRPAATGEAVHVMTQELEAMRNRGGSAA